MASKVEDRVYEPLEAIALVKDNATAKFDDRLEVRIVLPGASH